MRMKTIGYLCTALLCLAVFWTGTGCDLAGGGTGTLIMNLTDAPDVNARVSLKKDDAEEETRRDAEERFDPRGRARPRRREVDDDGRRERKQPEPDHPAHTEDLCDGHPGDEDCCCHCRCTR